MVGCSSDVEFLAKVHCIREASKVNEKAALTILLFQPSCHYIKVIAKYSPGDEQLA